MCFIFSTSFHSEVFLGDDQVYNTSNSLCDECIGLRPYSSPRRQQSFNDINRPKRDYNDLTDPLPPYDGNLDMGSNYTGFVEIVSKYVIHFIQQLFSISRTY